MAEESKALVPVEQKVVEFYGDELTAVLVDVEGHSVVYIPVRQFVIFWVLIGLVNDSVFIVTRYYRKSLNPVWL